MSISLNKYVDITSGVGGAAGVSTRDFIGRYISPSPNLLPGEVVEFASIDEVAVRFPETSPEYAAANMYFAFVSKAITSPKKLSFARWNKIASNPIVSGIVGVLGTDTLTLILDTTLLTLSIDKNDGTPPTVVNITVDFTGAANYDAVRADLQTALRASANSELTLATVTYTAATGQFQITGGVTSTSTFTAVAQAVATTDVALQMGLLPSQGAVSVPGTPIQTPLQAVMSSTDASDNFGSFGFIDSTSNPPQRLADADVLAVAVWNTTQNNKFMFCTPTTTSGALTAYATLKANSGVAETINIANDYAEFIPAEILAATDYTRPNASNDYMYVQVGNRTPSITTTTLSTSMDNVRANYVGQTMQAGQKISFYQRGVLMGATNAATDMNTYANEMWLKDSIATSILNAFLSLPRIPAADLGRGIMLSNIQYSIDQGLFNGTISVGKPLTISQKQYITSVTNDPNAWQQIQNVGWWLDVELQSFVTPDGRTEWKAVYVLVYSKDDQIRKVEGTDILI